MDKAAEAGKKAGAMASAGLKSASAFDDKHHISQRVGKSLSSGLDAVTRKMAPDQAYKVGADTPAAATLPSAPAK